MSDDQAKAQADAFKQEGNTAYKSRNFEQAEKAYKQAWEAYPKDITYLNNLAGNPTPSLELETSIATMSGGGEDQTGGEQNGSARQCTAGKRGRRGSRE